MLLALRNNSRILAVQLPQIFKFETCYIRPRLRREKKNSSMVVYFICSPQNALRCIKAAKYLSNIILPTATRDKNYGSGRNSLKVSHEWHDTL